MKNYKILQQLGTGSFGKVELALHIATQQNVAIKTISKKKLKTNQQMQMVNKQIAVFKSITHENIIRLYEIIQDQNFLYLIMEYADAGDMLNYIKNNGTLSQGLSLQFLRQLAQSVKYIHIDKCIAHRDIKLANILLTSKNNKIKLADFGLSNFYDKDCPLLRTSCGSPCYSAPQILKGNKYNPLSADIWSLGVVLYAMIEGALPFYDQNIKQLYKKVIKGKMQQSDRLSDQLKILIKKILQINPQSRIKISQLIQQIDELLRIKNKSYSSIQIPKLSTQSNDYVQSLKRQNIIRILVLNSYNEDQVRSALDYREKNKKAKKYNDINTFIQLLQRKNINKLAQMLDKYGNQEQNRKYQAIKISPIPFKKQLRRTNSSFTKDSIKDSNSTENKPPIKVRFARNTNNKNILIKLNKLSESQKRQVIRKQNSLKLNKQQEREKQNINTWQKQQNKNQIKGLLINRKSNTRRDNKISRIQKIANNCDVQCVFKDITKQYSSLLGQSNNGYIRLNKNKNNSNMSINISDINSSNRSPNASVCNSISISILAAGKDADSFYEKQRSRNSNKNKVVTLSLNTDHNIGTSHTLIPNKSISRIQCVKKNCATTNSTAHNISSSNCFQNNVSQYQQDQNDNYLQSNRSIVQQQLLTYRGKDKSKERQDKQNIQTYSPIPEFLMVSGIQTQRQQKKQLNQSNYPNSLHCSIQKTQRQHSYRSNKRQLLQEQNYRQIKHSINHQYNVELQKNMGVWNKPFNIMHTYNEKFDAGKFQSKLMEILANSQFQQNNQKWKSDKNSSQSKHRQIKILKQDHFKYLIKYYIDKVQKQSVVQLLKVQTFTNLKLIRIQPFNSIIFQKIKHVLGQC